MKFIARLPKTTAEWVQCHRPKSLDSAIHLAEDQLVACSRVGHTLPNVSLPSFSASHSSTPSPLPIPLQRSHPPGPIRGPPRGEMTPDQEGDVRGQPRGFASAGEASPHVSLLSPRQSRSGPACWHCGDPDHLIDRCPMIDIGTMIQIPDVQQAAHDQAGRYQIPWENLSMEKPTSMEKPWIQARRLQCTRKRETKRTETSIHRSKKKCRRGKSGSRQSAILDSPDTETEQVLRTQMIYPLR
ncbi:uncharacterized protein LOC143736688 [Siphateles boraxobius]|uniref:uncharacterized protein LOC143736688 n=1 Tax=Siphateles boraxobius TaxID=180520 RepID=UPI00406366FD